MKKAFIKPGCIGCGLCEHIAPEIFTVNNVSTINPDTDWATHQEKLLQAAQACPMQVILLEEINE
jgi:ferredoxin